MKTHSELLDTDKDLIILDACRFDIFAQEIINYSIDGDLKMVNSQAINTKEWYKKHIEVLKHRNLVSAQSRVWKDNFAKSFNSAKMVRGKRGEDSWLQPSETLDAALAIRHPRLIHLIQPHLPFMKSKGFPKEVGGTWLYKNINNWARKHGFEELRKLYRKNVRYALSNLEKYIPKFNTSLVLTADHGELLGEYNTYCHEHLDPEVDDAILRLVPWFEVE